MKPTDKAAIERMIMRIESMTKVHDRASIVGAVMPETGNVSFDRFRALIEEAISRYHAEPHGEAGPPHLATWSLSGGRGKV